jgi:hypothetical protein
MDPNSSGSACKPVAGSCEHGNVPFGFIKGWGADRHDRVVSIPASYSTGNGFKSRPEDRLSLPRFSLFFSVLPGNAGIIFYRYAMNASFHTLSISPCTYHPFIQRYIAG